MSDVLQLVLRVSCVHADIDQVCTHVRNAFAVLVSVAYVFRRDAVRKNKNVKTTKTVDLLDAMLGLGPQDG